MNADDEIPEAERGPTEGDDTGVLEDTDIESDEEMDGDVDAAGAAAIGERND